jgi:Zn-dependent hydrolases, including glyoxylases
MKTLLSLLIIAISSVNIAIAQDVVFADVFRTKIGSHIAVYTLSEGQQQGSTKILKNASEEIIQETAPDGTFPNAVNAFLIKKDGKNILVDTGFGRKLFDNLESIGVKSTSISAILLTHAHGDHIGGLVKDGKSTFPFATIYVSEKEHNYWISEKNKSYITVTELYNIKTFKPNKLNKVTKPVLEDIFAIEAYGHTPGHVGFLIKAKKGEKLLIWGDLTHAMAVQMPYPKVSVTYDVNPEEAAETRLKILDYVVKNNTLVAGMHIAHPATGWIIKKGNGFEFRTFGQMPPDNRSNHKKGR